VALRTNIGGSESFAQSSFTPTAGATYFVVVRVDYGATDVVRLWVNPVPGVQPTDASASATITLPAGQSFSVGNNITLNGGGYYNQATFDELRYGLTYLSVAPDPLVTPSAGPRALPVSALHAISSTAIKHITTLTLPAAAAISSPDKA